MNLLEGSMYFICGQQAYHPAISVYYTYKSKACIQGITAGRRTQMHGTHKCIQQKILTTSV